MHKIWFKKLKWDGHLDITLLGSYKHGTICNGAVVQASSAKIMQLRTLVALGCVQQ
jgi:hypothetical protein